MKGDLNRHRVSWKCENGWSPFPVGQRLSGALGDAVESRRSEKSLQRWTDEVVFTLGNSTTENNEVTIPILLHGGDGSIGIIRQVLVMS